MFNSYESNYYQNVKQNTTRETIYRGSWTFMLYNNYTPETANGKGNKYHIRVYLSLDGPKPKKDGVPFSFSMIQQGADLRNSPNCKLKTHKQKNLKLGTKKTPNPALKRAVVKRRQRKKCLIKSNSFSKLITSKDIDKLIKNLK